MVGYSAGANNARLKTGAGTERATPHKLTLSVLIRLYVSPDQQNGQDECPLTPQQVRELQLFLIHAIKDVDSIIEPVLGETCSKLEQNISNGIVVSNYLRRVLAKIDSPDALFDLLEHLRETLLPSTAASSAYDVDLSGRPTHIEPSCVFGVFLRRVLLSCKRSFEALSRLFHEMGLYAKAKSNGTSVPGITPRTKAPKRKMSYDDTDSQGPQLHASKDSAEKTSPDAAPSSAAAAGPKAAERTKRSVTSRSTRDALHPPSHKTSMFKSFVSRRQLQYHLHCMVDELEAKVGIASPVEVEEKVAEMLAVSPDLPRAHFVRYMNCLVHREYQGAVDSLHTYFDYCMRGGGPTSSAAIANASAAAVVASGGRYATHGSASVHATATLGKRRPMMQYAVLNLAALHYQFGHRREAMLAIQETVRVAQQNGDHVCVVFALSWLFRLASATGGQETAQLLRRCLNRARELGLNHVQGLSHLVTAQLRLASPTAVPTAMPPPMMGFTSLRERRVAPARVVWQSVERGVEASAGALGTYVEALSSSVGSGNGAGGRIGHRSQPQQPTDVAATGMPNQASRAAMSEAIKVVNASLASPSSHLASSLAIAGRAQLVQSAAWESYGHASLSWLGALSHLTLFSGLPGTSASDTCLAVCRLATAQANLGTVSKHCPTASVSGTVNDNAYVGALLLLLEAKKTYKHRANNVVVPTLVSLLQRRAIARGDVLESLLLGTTLNALTPSHQAASGVNGGLSDEGLHINAQVQWIDALKMMGRYTEAHAFTHELVGESTGHGMQSHAVQKVMDLTLAHIFLECGDAAVAALPYTLRCISYTEKMEHETLYNSATIKLAAIQLRMGHVNASYSLLLRALPHTVAHGTLQLRGDLRLLLAKCHIELSGRHPKDCTRHLKLACECMVEAHGVFQFACLQRKSQEVLYLLARTHDSLAEIYRERGLEKGYEDHVAARDQAAEMFISLRVAQSRPTVRVVGYLNNDQLIRRVACC